MTVPAIGGNVGSGSSLQTAQQSSLSEQDFINLFLTQLTFQDPLNPVSNTEFLAQLAEFTLVEQDQTLNDNLMGLLEVDASTQALSLLGKSVQVTQNGQNISGSVTAVSFSSGTPSLTVTETSGSVLTDVSPAEVTLVQQPSGS
jgi:flagellar basal-body rod modification protein FlgD